LSLSFLDQHFIFGYKKPLMHIVWSPFSLQSYQILSSERKLLIPSFPESRGEIPFKGGSLSCPEIRISECEPFSLINLNFQKDFVLFKFK
jgi:hypothetical protein